MQNSPTPESGSFQEEGASSDPQLHLPPLIRTPQSPSPPGVGLSKGNILKLQVPTCRERHPNPYRPGYTHEGKQKHYLLPSKSSLDLS